MSYLKSKVAKLQVFHLGIFFCTISILDGIVGDSGRKKLGEYLISLLIPYGKLLLVFQNRNLAKSVTKKGKGRYF